MTVVLELKPNVEKALQSKASAEGKTIEDYLQDILESILVVPAGETSSTEEWLLAFRQWANTPRREMPVLSEQAMSRESIYGDIR
jgi:hypothetical protein